MVRMRDGARALAALGMMAAAGAATAAPLGPAAAFGVFVFGDFVSSNTDSHLSIAAGGNAVLTNYGVGTQVSPSADARLVVGGAAVLTNGGVGQPQNGTVIAGGAVAASGFTATILDNQGVGGVGVDFAAAQATFQGLTAELAAQASTGSAVNAFGTLTLTGASSTLNVFNLTEADFEGSGTFNIDTPFGATNIINVAGANITFGPMGGQMFFNGVAGSLSNPENAVTLFNFYEATALDLNGSRAPQGSILAPYAAVTGGFGQANGQLIAASYSGNTEFHTPLFDGDLPQTGVVPLPAALPLLAAGLAALGAAARRRA